MAGGKGIDVNMKQRTQTAEWKRLVKSRNRKADFKNWGPYVADRAWGTVREDYSPDGSAWENFPFEHSHLRTYRWNEDGIGGVCNRFQNVALSLALWNGKDSILKERFYGLTGHQGNHGEDVKEYYFYMDSTPTHSYMKMLYKYPVNEYPYKKLQEENAKRSNQEPEYELYDALKEDFEANKYHDVYIEYAKEGEEDLLCKITIHNRDDQEEHELHVLPTLLFRNTWSWGYKGKVRPNLKSAKVKERHCKEYEHVSLENNHMDDYHWYLDTQENDANVLFCDNESNFETLFGTENKSKYPKDSINRFVVDGEESAVNPELQGTKASGHYKVTIPASGKVELKWRFKHKDESKDHHPFHHFDEIMKKRKDEADSFFNAVACDIDNDDHAVIQRQAFAGIMWSKMFYHYRMNAWLDGDPVEMKPPESRKEKGARNVNWRHLFNFDVMSMPDKWEYPWYACWDSAFHTLAIVHIDPEWAKRQLVLFCREWYMHPNGQLPAYEWAFDDVNPPVHAWATLRVYQIAAAIEGYEDTLFLEKVFQKLLMNFTWWVNRKDATGSNVFQGGFLGLDNIRMFNMGADMDGIMLEQADGTSWMGMYCLNLLRIALELGQSKEVYEDIATKFFEHFLYIGKAINGSSALWCDENKFYYDLMHTPDMTSHKLKVNSFVGLIPLFAVEIIERDYLIALPNFKARMDWFIQKRPDMIQHVAKYDEAGAQGGYLLSIVNLDKLKHMVHRMVDQEQFLSPHGLRSLSKAHANEPFVFKYHDKHFEISYEPAESKDGLYGGNSNWRGPIWFPVNYLMIESLLKYYKFYGDELVFEYPTGSGLHLTLLEIAKDLCKRCISLFERNQQEGKGRALYGPSDNYFNSCPFWKDQVLFYEFFHGDNGTGLGASHQTGWTALVAQMLAILYDNESTVVDNAGNRKYDNYHPRKTRYNRAGYEKSIDSKEGSIRSD